MSIRIIEEKLKDYNFQSVQEEHQALREISQEIILMSLAQNRFFKYACFHGGTSLRILYGLNRFSEDLDFLLLKPDKNFVWDPFIKNIYEVLKAYGYKVEVQDKSKMDEAIKKIFIKDDSLAKLLSLENKRIKSHTKKIKIKLEIDVNPPDGSGYENKYMDFPIPYAITIQNLESNFTLKNHALLCRTYIKGRDWYDFIWYISKKTKINFILLRNALYQAGPWKDQHLTVTKKWYISTMQNRIAEIDWIKVKQDVAPFIKQRDLASLDLWNTDYFLYYLEQLKAYV